MKVDQENFYWLFSSAAQSISAFVAFLLTGYALVLSVMDNLEGKDETLAEIHHKLKGDYYQRMRLLAGLTGVTVILSLGMVYLNGIQWSWKPFLYVLTLLLNVTVIIFGIYFVLSIINPNRYKTAAKELLKTEQRERPETGKEVDKEIFITDFTNLEKRLREKLNEKRIDLRRPNPPFQQMVEALYRSDLISREQAERMFRIGRFRNFVVHGRQETVHQELLNATKDAVRIVNGIK